MPNVYVEYLDRPVRSGATDRQRKILLNAASEVLKTNPHNKRAMFCLRINQPRRTAKEAYEQLEQMYKNESPFSEKITRSSVECV